MYMDQVTTEGFHLWIRQQGDIQSVLITESSADPEKRADSFALRAGSYNRVNGDERRLLDGEFLPQTDTHRYLIDSTPEYNEVLEGMAFHIYVPMTLSYGYPWSREGEIQITRGTWLNLRAFEKPYADYTGSFQDNPFILNARILPPPEPEEGPRETKDILEEAAGRTGGEFSRAENPDELLKTITRIIDRVKGRTIDVVLVVDTTVSMKEYLRFLQTKLIPLVRTHVAGFESYRIGLVFYRDYKEQYLTREYSFMDNINNVQIFLNKVVAAGGGDIPEAVYEGIFSGIVNFDWEADERIIIQVGDAGPHPTPRGEITKEMVYQEAQRAGISIYPILLPEN